MKYIIFSLLFCIVLSSYSQNNYLKWGEKYRVNNNTKFHKIIGWDKSNFYVLRKDYNYFIEKYDSNYKKIKESKIQLFIKWNQRDIEKIVVFHDSLYMFTSTWQSRKVTLYVTSINTETLLQNKEREVMQIPRGLTTQNSSFHIELSLRREKLLIYGQQASILPKIQTIQTKVFDKGMHLFWSDSNRIAYNNQYPRSPKITVSDNGDVGILSLVYEHYNFFKDAEVKNEYFLITYANNGATKNHHYVTIPHKYIANINVLALDNGSFICGGFYTTKQYQTSNTTTSTDFSTDNYYKTNSSPFNWNKKRYKSTFMNDLDDYEGTFYYKFDSSDKEPIMTNVQCFDQQLLQQHAKLSELVVDNKILSMSGNQMIVRKNGNILLIAEQFDTNYHEYNKPCHIFVFCYATDGSMSWHATIPKYQFVEYQNENYTSFAVQAPIDENSISIYFNNNEKNSLDCNEKTPTFFTERKPSYLEKVVIDEFGGISKSKIYHRAKKVFTPIPLSFCDKQNGEIIMKAQYNKDFNFFSIEKNTNGQ